MQAEEPTVCGGSEWKEKSSEGSGRKGQSSSTLAPRCLTAPSGRFFDLSQGLFPHLQDEKNSIYLQMGRTELYVRICLIHNPWSAHNKYSYLSYLSVPHKRIKTLLPKIHFPLLYISIKLVSSNSISNLYHQDFISIFNFPVIYNPTLLFL